MKKVKVLIPLSGGKDSQAAMLWAIDKYGLDNCETVFCDVKWEANETYSHIDYLVGKSGVKHNVLVSKKYDGMVDLAKKKGRFPSAMARFCTSELKVVPMIDFILQQKQHLIIIDGVRGDESEKRSKLNMECRFFKHYFQPYETNTMIVNAAQERQPVTLLQKKRLQKAVDRLAEGKDDPKYYTYRKKDVFKWCEKFDDSLIRPFFNDSADDVILYSLNKGYSINPLYFQGFSRVGCQPCVMANQSEVTELVLHNPKAIEKLRQAEKDANSSFFPPDKIPKRYHSKTAGNGKTYPTIDDVVRYIQDKNSTGNLFDEQEKIKGCKSVYKICE
jgi:3'-phosphoadenosine 5'-phosphosulfate sulfotransferase (PAPS reductase)/FAD synthetase